MRRRDFLKLGLATGAVMVFTHPVFAAPQAAPQDPPTKKDRKKITTADRLAAAARMRDQGFQPAALGTAQMAMPSMAPHYFSHPNYANSPLPGNAVLEWNAIAQQIVQPPPMPGMGDMSPVSMSAAFVYLSYVHAAIYNALVAIEGGYEPYYSSLTVSPTASRPAAIAAAAHGVLNGYFPSPALEAKYAAALGFIADGPEKDAGIAVGRQAAADIIGLRSSDVLTGNGTYTLQPSGPGVWQPTMMMPDGTMAPPVDPWMAVLKPFMRASPSQFRPEPPPSLSSPEYATQLNEVKAIGAAASATRTAEQTEVASFWATNGVIQYNTGFRAVAAKRKLGLLDTARLFAMANMIGTDALIATFDAKYTHNFWRPVTAIRRADEDGNNDTVADPTWMPLLMTPNHPEYVAGHATFASAQAEVLSHLFGPANIDLDLASTVTGTTRHYATADDLRTEIVDARTWGGIHLRGSSVRGVALGQTVAVDALANYFRPNASTETGLHAAFSGGIRKFVDGLPGLGAANANNLGQYIPVAVPDTTTYPATPTSPAADYYEIAVVEYQKKMHSDLPPTTLRGYVQLSTDAVHGKALKNPDGTPINLPNGQQALAVDDPHYLGPTIVATKDRPVRILFRNLLPTGHYKDGTWVPGKSTGDLFIPVDTTVMGSGMGPLHDHSTAEMDPQNPHAGMAPKPDDAYSENRAVIHLHGGISPWISDGTPHQWITPAGERKLDGTPLEPGYDEGVSVVDVPDMWFVNGALLPNTAGQTTPPVAGATNDPGPGATTYYYTNQQSARLLFYHDHSWGITRLNVYAGEAAPYVIADPKEQELIEAGIIPGATATIPLVVQDKTFVPGELQLATQDELWDLERWGREGSLWLPHVYSPIQNPGDSSGINAYGRWAYGPWFWPPTSGIEYGPIPNPYADTTCDSDQTGWCEPPLMPGVPFNSMGMEAFLDTPVVNGTVYPYLEVDPRPYRFRILNAANDRFFNLSLYKAKGNGPVWNPDGTMANADAGEVALNPAEVAAALEAPADIFPTPDTSISPPGPDWIQIGTEGGFLPAPAVIPAHVTTWWTDPGLFIAGTVNEHSLLLAPAERADVIVDFSQYAGQTLILYNDAPAAFPARDPRYDYYTGNADLIDAGGTPPTIPGYGPNTRTVMQIRVKDTTPSAPFNLSALQTAFKSTNLGGRGVFESSQHPIVVGQGAYNSAYNTSFRTTAPLDGFVRIHQTDSLTFDTLIAGTLTMPLQPKQIQDEMGEAFDPLYGRMSGFLGVETPNPTAGAQNMVLLGFTFPPTEVVDPIELSELAAAGVELEPIASANDGTQLWRITHNGVDTHPIHFHLYDVQLLNRVGWDNMVLPPDANELGWKDTVRISPLQDTIVALRPLIPRLPFDLPNSVRLLDPSMREGAVIASSTLVEATGKGMMVFAPNGEPIDVYNHYVNFGQEYVWHCHILSHEEMDMMRAQVVGAAPRAPTGLTLSVKGTSATLTWTDNSANETSFIVQRAADPTFTTGLTIFTVGPNVTTYVDNTIKKNTTYYYRVFATNLIGDTWDYSDPNLNEGAAFPTKRIDSAYSNTATLGEAPAAPPAAPTDLAAAVQAGPQVALTWRDNANDETGFVVERAVDGVTFTVLATVGTNATSYVDTAVAAGNTYTYRVKAVNAGGSSAYSNVASATISGGPAAPSNVAATAVRVGNNARVTLTWTDNSNNETGFRIQRATNTAFTAGLTTVTVGANTTTYQTGNITRNTDFYFRIQAYNNAGASAWVLAAPLPIRTP